MQRFPDGDTIVALLGIVLALVLVSRSSSVSTLTSRRKAVYGAIWAVVIGVVAAVAMRFTT